MQRLFEMHLENAIPDITMAELQHIHAGCVFKKLRKKETVLREGEVSKHKIFVMSGLHKPGGACYKYFHS